VRLDEGVEREAVRERAGCLRDEPLGRAEVLEADGNAGAPVGAVLDEPLREVRRARGEQQQERLVVGAHLDAGQRRIPRPRVELGDRQRLRSALLTEGIPQLRLVGDDEGRLGAAHGVDAVRERPDGVDHRDDGAGAHDGREYPGEVKRVVDDERDHRHAVGLGRRRDGAPVARLLGGERLDERAHAAGKVDEARGIERALGVGDRELVGMCLGGFEEGAGERHAGPFSWRGRPRRAGPRGTPRCGARCERRRRGRVTRIGR
jgi:hypothetical protein